MGEEVAGQPDGAGGGVGAGVTGDLAGGRHEGGGGVAAQEGGRDAVTGAQGGGEGFEVAVQDDAGEGGRVAGQGPYPGEPQVVGALPGSGSQRSAPGDRSGTAPYSAAQPRATDHRRAARP